MLRVRNLAFDRGWLSIHRADVAVVSVGNLTAGGTGKTPCVEYVARFYRQLDLRVAILSRGYGTASGPNDEALMLEENLPDVPHLVGVNRAELAATAVEELESEVLVLDDGLQHRRLARDLDVVLIDATCPWGYGHLLPRGLMREPARGLRRADMVVLTRCDQVSSAERIRIRDRIDRIARGVPVAESRHRPVELNNADQATKPISVLNGRTVAAFAGIGNSEAFRQTLADLGVAIVAFRSYPDHHPYSRADVDDLRAWADGMANVDFVITTQKDLVKLRLSQLGAKPLWALRIAFEVDAGREQLEQRLRAAVASHPGRLVEEPR